uniref:Trophoblast glycoprotein n=1 Tax=Pelusios castaneus TaxID=367368 RepID=A0A8C8VNU9_9SAUR
RIRADLFGISHISRAALGLLLLQLLLGWGSALQPGSCPAPCECSEAARTVQCVNGNLTAVPRDLPPYARLLCLTGNRLASLPPGAFLSPPLPELCLLNLSGSQLRHVEAGALAGLPSLRQLDLSSNALLTLSPEAFGNATSPLEELNLSNALGNQSLVPDLCFHPGKMWDKPLVNARNSDLNCSVPVDLQTQLQTSYVFLGIVLALIGAIFLLVLYLNRKGIKKWMYNIRDACRDHMEDLKALPPCLLPSPRETTDLFVPCGEYASM